MKSMLPIPSPISNQIPEADLSLGAHGEDYIIRNAFTLFGSKVKDDRRDNHREGELLLADGRLVEVKSDFTIYPRVYGTVVVEINHPHHEPWYPCCKKNRVVLITWCFYRIHKDGTPYRLPYAILVVPFARLVELIEDHHAYNTLKNTNLISIKIRDILGYCGSEAYYFRLMHPHDDITQQKIFNLRNLLQSLLPANLVLGEQPTQIIFNDRTHSEEEDETEWVRYTPNRHESSIRRAHSTTQR